MEINGFKSKEKTKESIKPPQFELVTEVELNQSFWIDVIIFFFDKPVNKQWTTDTFLKILISAFAKKSSFYYFHYMLKLVFDWTNCLRCLIEFFSDCKMKSLYWCLCSPGGRRGGGGRWWRAPRCSWQSRVWLTSPAGCPPLYCGGGPADRRGCKACQDSSWVSPIMFDKQ